MQKQEIDSWLAPKWHADFGDAERELSMLKVFSLCLLENTNRFRVALDCIEEGYMKIDVLLDERKCGEIYAIKDGNDMKYGLFVFNDDIEKDEFYFHDPHEGVQRLLRECIDQI